MTLKQNSGGYIGGVTPVPIPNTEVKPTRADGTPRETARESRSLPDLFLLESPDRRKVIGAFACQVINGDELRVRDGAGASEGQRRHVVVAAAEAGREA